MNIALALPDMAYNSYLHGMIWGEEIDALGLKAAFEKRPDTFVEIVTPNILKYLEDSLNKVKFDIVIHFDYPTFKVKDAINVLFFQQYYSDEIIDQAQPSFSSFDLVITNSKTTSERFNNVYYFPLAVDEEKFTPGTPNERYICDVVFIGNTRMRSLEQYDKYLLPAKDNNLHIYGTGWNDQMFSAYHPYYKGSATFDEMIEIYRSARIVISIHNEKYINKFGLVTNRIFHTISTGVVLISDIHPVMMEMFPEGCGVLYTEGNKNTKDIISKLLKNPEKQKEIINKGREVLYTQHTWSKRVEYLMSLLPSGNNITSSVEVKIGYYGH
ncbi:glycosyltransferase family protein [Paenibacillus motobuensis]|uniref:Spore protein YkvP/CgeB glycosyl transferase-like domain-containing protein n=1 Tax=Paenibacillus motobuensis TaxID=295324 RepID=A0ABN0Y631_9BACL